MKIVHLTGHSLVRFTPARIATYWGRYTEHTGVGVCVRRGGGWGQHREPLNPQGIFFAGQKRKELNALLDEADVIHCHDDVYPTSLRTRGGQVLVYHAHIGDIPRRMFRGNRYRYHGKVKHAAITNGYGHLFDEEEKRARVKWHRLPDILDLEHPTYSPEWELRARNPEFTVVFTFSNKHGLGRKINAKCPRETEQRLAPLKGRVRVELVTGVTFEESMARKKRAHVVLDEIFSPYTHLSVLEGAAVGACVLTSYNDYTRNELCDWLGAPRESYPFVRVTPENVAKKILHLSEHPDEADAIGRASYEWMHRYYHPRALLNRYAEFYRS